MNNLDKSCLDEVTVFINGLRNIMKRNVMTPARRSPIMISDKDEDHEPPLCPRVHHLILARGQS